MQDPLGPDGSAKDETQPQCSDDEIAAAVRVLEAAAADEQFWMSKRCKQLRKVFAPLSQSFNARMFGGKDGAEYKRSKDSRLQESLVRNNLKLEDKKFLTKTKLRAGRMQKLQQLTEEQGLNDMPLVLDGVAEEPAAFLHVVHDAAAQGALTDAQAEASNASTAAAASSEQAAASMGDASSPAPPPDAACPSSTRLHYPRACYTCKSRFLELHHFYDTLCPPCAELNWRKRHQSADLRGRIALVTGARVKIGFHVCCKLLRAGAAVIATSRFPHDAAARFAALPDYATFKERLRIYGLDLRDIPTLESFCAKLSCDLPRLDILINNACQTVRRPPQYYAHLMGKENTPVHLLPEPCQLFVRDNACFHDCRAAAAAGGGGGGGWVLSGETGHTSHRHAARLQDVQPDVSTVAQEAAPSPPPLSTSHTLTSAQLSQVALLPSDAAMDAEAFPTARATGSVATDVNSQQIDLRKENSWTARAHEVSTPELAEVMAINAIAPFLLCTRLKSLMQRGTHGSSSSAGEQAHGQGGLGAGKGDAAAPISLAEAMLHKLDGAGDGNDTGEGHDSGEGARKRGRAIGGAAKVPRRDVAGGATHGETAQGVPAWKARFIVNVSSMEGKFYRAKTATHPHTNMAKSALNQLVRTSARDYAASYIYMTAVDTGWINEENPLEIAARTAARHGFATPLDEVDAAARILDPVLAPLAAAQGEAGDGTCAPTYGAFLKDYFATEW